MTKFPIKSVLILCVAGIVAQPVVAEESGASASGSQIDQFLDGSIDIGFRYRFEGVDDDAFSDDAESSTLRSRLTLSSGVVSGWQAVVEVDDIREVIWDDFNAGAGNTPNRANYPTVADPEGTEVNQVFVRYQHNDELTVKLGRQRINLDNQRFVGGVGWRQNEQTYDALNVGYKQDALALSYTYVDNVNRIFGEDVSAGDHRQDGTHLLNGAWQLPSVGKLSAYYYHIDNEDAVLFSTATLGVRLQGKQELDNFSVRYALEFARQEDAANNPSSYDADYIRGDIGVLIDAFDIGVGFESLGAESGGRFVTPFATLHAFNGWADKFLAGGSGNPAGGLEDQFFVAKYNLANTYKLQAIWHSYESDIGGNDLGDELNLSFGAKINDHFKADLFYADFDGDAGISDVTKFWLQLTLAL